MKIELEVPENKVAFVMELLHSIPFIKAKYISTKTTQDTTEYLLSSSKNSKRLINAIERAKKGEAEIHDLIEK